MRPPTDTGIAELKVKGGYRRDAIMHPATIEHLQAWLAINPARSGPVFCRVRKDGAVEPGGSISDHTAWRVVTRRRDQAGADPKITPHSLRRWYVTSLLEAGVDVLMVSRAVGHRNPNTTQRYDRRGDHAIRQAITHLHLPTIDDLTTNQLTEPGA